MFNQLGTIFLLGSLSAILMARGAAFGTFGLITLTIMEIAITTF